MGTVAAEYSQCRVFFSGWQCSCVAVQGCSTAAHILAADTAA